MNSSQNVTEFKWREDRQLAAQLVAEDRISDEQIAEKCGVSRRTLATWKLHPTFHAEVNRLVSAYANRILSQGIARKEKRIAAMNDRWMRMQRIIEDRANAADGFHLVLDGDDNPEDIHNSAPGIDSGLLVRQTKSIGFGENNTLISEYAVDTGLLREIRELEKQAAQELGQWTEKSELTGRDGGPIEVSDVGLSDEERAERIASLLDRAGARRARQPSDS